MGSKTSNDAEPHYHMPFHLLTQGCFIDELPKNDHILHQESSAHVSTSHQVPSNIIGGKAILEASDDLVIEEPNIDMADGWSDADLDLNDMISPELSHMNSASSLKVMAEQYSVDIKEKRRDMEIRDFVLKRKLDLVKFENTEDYRNLFLAKAAKTLNLSDWDEIVSIGSHFNYDKSNVTFV